MRLSLLLIIFILGILMGFVLGYTIAYAKIQDHVTQPIHQMKPTDLPTTTKVPETPVSYQTHPEYPQNHIKNMTVKTND